MRNLYHDTGTVTRLITCLSTSMFHVFQHPQGVIHQFVTLTAVDIHNHSHAASIMLVVRLI